MSALDIIVNRDLENDVLYVIKKEADKTDTINVSANSDTLLRLDRKTRKLVGLTIEDFSRIYPDLKDHKDWILMEHFDHVIDLVNASHLAMSKT
jgi:hypothetical protein